MVDRFRLPQLIFLPLLFSVVYRAQAAPPEAFAASMTGKGAGSCCSCFLPGSPAAGDAISGPASSIPVLEPRNLKSCAQALAFFANPQVSQTGLNEMLPDLLALVALLGLIVYLLRDRHRTAEEARKLALLSRDLKGAKQACEESEERFRLLVENVPGVIYLCNGDDRQAMRYLNSAVRQLTGYPKEDFLSGKVSLINLCDVSDVRGVQSAINRAVAERRPFHLLYRLKRQSGEWRWIEEFGAGIFQGTTLLHLEGFLSDVTERKRTEEGLRASEERHRLLFERNLAGVYHCTLDGDILDCNQAFARMCGFGSSKEARESSGWRFFSGSDRQAALTRLRKLGTLTNFETRFERKDGRSVWVLENASLLKGERDTPSIIEGTLFDITNRKSAEQMLEHFKRQNELILNSAGEGICGLDRLGNTTFVNPAAARMLGRRITDVNGYSHHVLLQHPDLEKGPPPPSECEICATLRDGSMRQVDNSPFWRKDGTSFPVEYICTAIRDELGSVVGAVVTFRDVTERKLLEEQLRRAQKMEAVGTLAGGVAHDFNNLLTGILGFVDIVLQQIDQTDPLRADVNEIKKAAQRAASLTRQLLAFSRQQVIAPQLLDLDMVVADVENMLSRLIGENIDLIIARDPALWRVKADAGQVQQIIMNLAVNARDAMLQGGKLTISTANVDLDESRARRHGTAKPGAYVMLEVTDTGIGMDEQTRSRLFEPFFTTKEKGKGTGLGLATVYGIVRQAGGHLSVRSEQGHGTTFQIYLPRAEEKTEAAEPGQTPGSALAGSETILLAEDEESVRFSLGRGLVSMGYTVLAARDGTEAASLSERHPGPIHLLLTDVVMPNMSGPELASRLAPLRPEMTVVYMSGYMDETVVQHGMLDDSAAFLQKPFTQEVLASKVRQVLDAVPV